MAYVLVVDDSKTDRAVLGDMLVSAGHEPVFAEDGEEALRACMHARVVEQAIDVVLMDLWMPKLHGFQAITLLRNLPDPPAIIAISSSGEPQLEMAMLLGAKLALSKPVERDVLIEAVESLVPA